MTLFMSRLEGLRKAAIEYIVNKVDEKGPIVLDEYIKIYRLESNCFLGTPAQTEGGLDLYDMDIEELCDIADRIHTLPAKDLPEWNTKK